MMPRIEPNIFRTCPRYTSYPTAPHFSAEVDAKRYESWLTRLDPNSEHFALRACAVLPADVLVLRLQHARDRTLFAGDGAMSIRSSGKSSWSPASFLEGVTVGHIHWGGGTPTALAPDDMVRIDETDEASFQRQASGAEIAVEIDPRTFTPENAGALGKIGCTRASLGVQEFDDKVQNAINRVQPVSMIEDSLGLLREQGIHCVNFDLMYGLPYQTAETIKETVELAANMNPDRIALFGYAHVPWMAKNQKMIPEEALPTPQTRYEQAEGGGRRARRARLCADWARSFRQARGQDGHCALAEGRLHRNFQGYTDDEGRTIVAFGASAISALPDGFAQNIVETGGLCRAP